ncbi:MAG: capsular polysaccharide synthesis protein [Flavobacteriaceae bacterium]|nr:capsular polysaccharide synthesis protein [Flavobacteriaceae bacterium]
MNVNKIFWGKGKENKEEIPRIIWMYWEGQKSLLVERCIAKVYDVLPEYQINILDNKSIKKFLPNIIEKNQHLPIANYSDVIRLDLLRTYGGIWMDASILLTENLDWVYKLKNQYHTDVIGFYAEFITTNNERPILETYFLAAPKGNEFITDWYNEFVSCYKSIHLPPPYNYYKDIKNDIDKIQGMKGEMVDYLLAYLSAMKIMIENDNYRILMLNASESAHYYTFNLWVKYYELWNIFLFNKSKDAFYPKPIIKFRASHRDLLDHMLYRGKETKQSLLYRLSPDKNYYKNKFLGKMNNIKFVIKKFLTKLKK